MQYSNPCQADHNRFCLPLHYTYAYIISLWKAKERICITEITTPEQLYGSCNTEAGIMKLYRISCNINSIRNTRQYSKSNAKATDDEYENLMMQYIRCKNVSRELKY